MVRRVNRESDVVLYILTFCVINFVYSKIRFLFREKKTGFVYQIGIFVKLNFPVFFSSGFYFAK